MGHKEISVILQFAEQQSGLNSLLDFLNNMTSIEDIVKNILSLSDFSNAIKTITSVAHAENIVLALQQNNYLNIKEELKQILHEVNRYTLFSWYSIKQRKQQLIDCVLHLSPYWLTQISTAFAEHHEINPFQCEEVNAESNRVSALR